MPTTMFTALNLETLETCGPLPAHCAIRCGLKPLNLHSQTQTGAVLVDGTGDTDLNPFMGSLQERVSGTRSESWCETAGAGCGPQAPFICGHSVRFLCSCRFH